MAHVGLSLASANDLKMAAHHQAMSKETHHNREENQGNQKAQRTKRRRQNPQRIEGVDELQTNKGSGAYIASAGAFG